MLSGPLFNNSLFDSVQIQKCSFYGNLHGTCQKSSGYRLCGAAMANHNADFTEAFRQGPERTFDIGGLFAD